jgi:hypothetical protein
MSDHFSLCRVALLSDGVAVQVNGRVSEASVEVVVEVPQEWREV